MAERNVVVVGGGIGGLAAAVALHRRTRRTRWTRFWGRVRARPWQTRPLAACLDATPNVGEALARYDWLRRPRTQAIVRRSARLGTVAQWSWPPAVVIRDLAARLTPAAATLRSMAPVLDWTPPMPTEGAGL